MGLNAKFALAKGILKMNETEQEKPPLLSDEEIRARLKELPANSILFYQSSYEESSIKWNEFIAQAQRELDIKYYEGG